ncbi:GNAT family N-acetyltransferase [Cytobacillus depressus]|uniref:GNAT family N-acetyltransferase n=1 Tax=Cytobacillus depressus TaxID=1602942 RepID=UPI001FE9FC96|nr:GNAT family N-acetyltransferase [Cytobacillus depressus]
MSVFKNNEKYTIRTGKVEDAEAVLEIQKSVIAEGDYLISVSEEFIQTLEQQREWIQGLLENRIETLIVAEINGEVVGWIVFLSQYRKRLSHTGSFGMMISKRYRGMGIGKMLIRALLDWAEKNPLIEKVCLGVFSTNHRAISLYKSMGFVEEGRKIKEIKINENEYVDDILMYKFVNKN